MINDYVWVLPAVIGVGWVLSWWRARWVRWAVLSAGIAVSVLTFLSGVRENAPPLPPEADCTRQQVQCADFSGLPWMVNGLIGLASCAVLLLITIVVGIVVWIVRRTGPEPTR